MKLIETAISGKMVRMRYADDDNPEEATQWFEFQVRLQAIGSRPGGPDQPIPEFGLQYLEQLHRAALLRARDTINDELDRLRNRALAVNENVRMTAPLV